MFGASTVRLVSLTSSLDPASADPTGDPRGGDGGGWGKTLRYCCSLGSWWRRRGGVIKAKARGGWGGGTTVAERRHMVQCGNGWAVLAACSVPVGRPRPWRLVFRTGKGQTSRVQ